MTQRNFPDLICDDFAETRDALQVYTQMIGDWRTTCLPRRKHWWQISVYPSVRGLTTGMIHSSIDFELELDLQSDRLHARVAEETSPIQVWPHHFDLAMLWLPGEKIPGQDPADEETSDKQMNFGFTFGDANISDPYFYITAYPLPDGLPTLTLPDGTEWQSDGFSGAVLPYRRLLEETNPWEYLVSLWNGLLSAGRQLMLDDHK